jgi:hypothetical protein
MSRNVPTHQHPNKTLISGPFMGAVFLGHPEPAPAYPWCSPCHSAAPALIHHLDLIFWPNKYRLAVFDQAVDAAQ